MGAEVQGRRGDGEKGRKGEGEMGSDGAREWRASAVGYTITAY